ncbi:ABC transporter ATP-binding protein [Thiothrix litoralis]|uniref:ABC transporter ATP-binding protein n=1 Tax=Thiothrix litoralis TaxID=2891210 RepID=A0ABX7WXU1_9GAMM|nr:ABC transporter ATP-binding protein [Thiothrix litoralis]QTR46439.1 ABC transporter ATP-binding protein [Thiothrix litoralis]
MINQQKNLSLKKLIARLWQHISPRRRRQFGLLLVLMVLASFAEIVSIGAVLPFLGVLTAPERVFEHAAAQPLIQALGLSEPEQLLLPLTIAFGVAAIVAGTMRLLLLWVSTRLSFATGADLSISIYRRTLYQPYAIHCARNSSEIINGISTKSNQVIYNTIVPILTLVSSSIMLVVILVALLAVNPVIALVAFGGFGLIYALIIRLTRKRLLAGSQRIAHESTQVIKSLQEGLGGIRDVLIDGNQATYCQVYRNADLPLRRAQGNNLFISSSPRFGMEALGMLLIALLAYSLAQQEDGVAKAIPVLGALALGAQRLLPVLQQAYGAWSQIRGGQMSLQDTIALLEQPLPAHADQPVSEALSFKQQIQLQQLAFRYSDATPWILRDINLTIPKGSRIGFIGATGSGKSTLIDIIMGLLPPTEGTLAIDGQVLTAENQRTWQQHIAHVPQSIFLADSTVAENIAFGIPKEQIDHGRVRLAAQQAQIAESIESWPEQYQTFVGERGIRLSGGQRQRIGIARALYKQADVIVFDEATSALDTETEQAVMQAIESLSNDLTLIIIAHRLTTLKNCTQIVELGDGHIKRIGSYQAIISDSVAIQSNDKEQQTHA